MIFYFCPNKPVWKGRGFDPTHIYRKSKIITAIKTTFDSNVYPVIYMEKGMYLYTNWPSVRFYDATNNA